MREPSRAKPHSFIFTQVTQSRLFCKGKLSFMSFPKRPKCTSTLLFSSFCLTCSMYFQKQIKSHLQDHSQLTHYSLDISNIWCLFLCNSSLDFIWVLCKWRGGKRAGDRRNTAHVNKEYFTEIKFLMRM